MKISNLKIINNGVHLLDVPHFEPEKGKVTAILGANGSGKTTLLERIAFDHIKKEKKTEILLLMQRPVLFNMSVIDNIVFGLDAMGLNRETCLKRAGKILDRFKISALETRHAKTLSGGEKKLVALASLVIMEPKWLLLDEPFANIDMKNASLISDIIHEEAHGGVGVVFTAHNIPEFMEKVRHIYKISSGRLHVH